MRGGDEFSLPTEGYFSLPLDRENGRYLTFLTNNFLLPVLTIAKFYKLRWNVELFFRWIKQNLRIKSFYGTSEYALRTQIWVANYGLRSRRHYQE